MMETGSGSNKKQKACQNEDQINTKISSLPDSVIVNILSRLPTKDAVKALMFPPFHNLWASAYNIDLDECSFHQCPVHEHDSSDDDYSFGNRVYFEHNNRFVRFVRNVLLRHQCYNIDRFRLRFEFHMENQYDTLPGSPSQYNSMLDEKGVSHEIDSWIQFAVRRRVKVLELDFLACGLPGSENTISLPRGVLCSDTIVELKLVYCELNSSADIRMSSLRSLYLKEISLDDSMMENILSGCPLLENLSIVHCHHLRKLTHTAKNLKHLSIFFRRLKQGYYDYGSQVEIFCPNVVSLDVSGCIDRLDVKDISSVVDASIKLAANFDDDERGVQDSLRKILSQLHHAENIRFCKKCMQVLTLWELTYQQCPSLNVECLVLETEVSEVHISGIARLLINTPKLEALDVYISPSDPTSSSDEDDELLEMDEEGSHDSHSQQQLSDNCPLNHLKKIAIYGYSTEPCHALLVEFLLKNAGVLEEMAIHTNRVAHSELQESLDKLLKLPKASMNAVILFD